MKPSIQDEAEGKFHDLKGKVKKKAGQLTNDPDLEAEGQAEEISGKVQEKVGQVKKVLGK
ncbi:MAG: CsbD family protein [Candidatus Acidiferrum sp.]